MGKPCNIGVSCIFFQKKLDKDISFLYNLIRKKKLGGKENEDKRGNHQRTTERLFGR
jgi:hypothetical protein